MVERLFGRTARRWADHSNEAQRLASSRLLTDAPNLWRLAPPFVGESWVAGMDDEEFDLWRLSTEFSVLHAALIIAGYSPDIAEANGKSVLTKRCPGFLPAKTALCNAIKSEVLVPVELTYEESEYGTTSHINIYSTLLSVSDLWNFTSGAGKYCGTFDRRDQRGSGQLSSAGGFFSKKLDAANKAWAAVTSDPSRLRGKSPKQALEDWLTENAANLGLLNKAGQPNRTGIDEIAKVANWKPEGGATPTQSVAIITPRPSPLAHNPTPG